MKRKTNYVDGNETINTTTNNIMIMMMMTGRTKWRKKS